MRQCSLRCGVYHKCPALTSLVLPTARQLVRGRRQFTTQAVGWVSRPARLCAVCFCTLVYATYSHKPSPSKLAQDPEGILASPQGGHIARRSLQKQVMQDKELAKQVEAERERARAELQKLRDVGPAVPLHPVWALALSRLMAPPVSSSKCHSGAVVLLVLRRRALSPGLTQRQCNTFWEQSGMSSSTRQPGGGPC